MRTERCVYREGLGRKREKEVDRAQRILNCLVNCPQQKRTYTVTQDYSFLQDKGRVSVWGLVGSVLVLVK